MSGCLGLVRNRAVERRRACRRRQPRYCQRELLLDEADLHRVWVLRKVLTPLSPIQAMELLLDKMAKTESNAAFLASMQRMG